MCIHKFPSYGPLEVAVTGTVEIILCKMYFCQWLYVSIFLLEVCSFIAKQRSICSQAEEQAVTAGDLYHGLTVVQPSAMKELAIEKPNVSHKVQFLFDLASR